MEKRVLITGGARSGKSTAAEVRLSGFQKVRYVATSVHDGTDSEWTDRVLAHQRRRPTTWSTIETADLVGQIELSSPERPVLVDCLTVWLARRLDELNAWSTADYDDSVDQHQPDREDHDDRLVRPPAGSGEQRESDREDEEVQLVRQSAGSGEQPDLVHALISQEIGELVNAIADCPGGLVIVTNEVGSGIVPSTASGRQFRDLMGFCNAAVAQVCDEVVLLVAGCELRIKGSG